ncbi:hypothetical protein ACFL7D_06455 [candidate division KSB1 bacterium]
MIKKTKFDIYFAFFLINFALAVYCPTITFCQVSDVSVESGVDKSNLTVGELALYEVTVTHKPEIKVTMPPPGINLGGFEIREYNEVDPAEKDGLIERKVQYTIAAYDTGQYVIPPTGVLYMLSDSLQNVLLTDAVPIYVKSILTGEESDIKDIKDQVNIITSNSLFWIIVITVSALLAGILGYWYYKKKKRGESIFEWKKEPELPAHIDALNALNKLKQSDLLSDGKIKEYYIELSEILRYYLQRRYFKMFLEMTTTETKETLSEIDITDEARLKTEKTLEECDLVKFAKFVPGEEVHSELLDAAFEIVESTKIEKFDVKEDISAQDAEYNDVAEVVQENSAEEVRALPDKKFETNDEQNNPD